MIAQNLQRLMEARALDTERVAVLCDVSYYTVQSWLSGSRTPSAANIRALAHCLTCSADELLAA